MENMIRKQLDQNLIIRSNRKIASDVYEMVLEGNTELITAPGQFINISLPGLFLRRPISICDWDEDKLTIIYKVVGKGTDAMSSLQEEFSLNCLMGLGNGFDISLTGDNVLLVGGGVGTPPMYGLAKKLLKAGKQIRVILGFNSRCDAFYIDEFKKLEKISGSPIDIKISTVDGTLGIKGFVTDCIGDFENVTDYCACGPIPMLKALFRYFKNSIPGQLSFEERMGCGFGACVGCSIKTASGNKKVCKDGPVFLSSEVAQILS